MQCRCTNSGIPIANIGSTIASCVRCFVALGSGGGDLQAGIEIGKLIRLCGSTCPATRGSVANDPALKSGLGEALVVISINFLGPHSAPSVHLVRQPKPDAIAYAGERYATPHGKGDLLPIHLLRKDVDPKFNAIEGPSTAVINFSTGRCMPPLAAVASTSWLAGPFALGSKP